MRSLLSVAVLISMALPVFAATAPTPLPEPETLGLLAVGAVGMMLAMRRKK
jgi:hypothetical protein